mmetsp:Transcript_88359/g.274664  ORF Transcript_88359/g.274664 Transcript_88359/m.274664 type:complete len:352 (-) Transcript_88359:469-1524(-)
MEAQLHLAVHARVGIAEGVKNQCVLARVGDLEAQLLLDEAVPFQIPLKVHDSCGRRGLVLVLLLVAGRDQEEPPLLELRLREERRVDRTYGLVLAEVLPHHLHRDGGHIAHNYLPLVLHLDVCLELNLPYVLAEGLDIGQLVGHEPQHGLALLRVRLEELGEGGDLGGLAPRHVLLLQVRNLQQLGAPHVQRLHKAPPEVEHGLRRGEPLAHAGNLDHGLGDLHGVLQQRVAVASQLGRHEGVTPLHVRPDEELVLHHDGQGEGAPLVLDHLPRELLHRLVVRGARHHGAALGAGPQELRAGLEAGRLVHVVPEELQRVDHDAVGGEVLRPLIVADECYGDDEDEDEEEGA